MKTLTVKKYNEMRTAQWKSDWDKKIKEPDGIHQLPQLAFYIFEKKTGYVAFSDNKAYWGKTKKQAIINFKS